MSPLSIKERSGVQVMDGFSSVAEAMSYLALRDIRIIEINLNNPYFLAQVLSSKERQEIAKIVSGEGITWSAHVPEGMAFFEVAEPVFARYLGWLVRLQELTGEAGCRALTIHIGSPPHFAYSGQKRQGLDLYREFYETTFILRLRRAANHIRKSPPVCVENVGTFHQQFVRDLLEDTKLFSYAMDIGHLMAAHPRIAEAELEFYRRNLKNIKVVHVHSNDGEWDEHMPFTGVAKLEPYIGVALESRAWLVMEIRPLESAISSLAVLTGVEGQL